MGAKATFVVASMNPVKVHAFQDVIKTYACFTDSVVEGKAVPSGVSEQPLSFEETLQGAKNRAINAYGNCDYSVGIESGIMIISGAEQLYLENCVCVIYDGSRYHIGHSCGFQVPPAVMQAILAYQMDFAQAFLHCGFSDNPKLGQAEGAVGLMTSGRITRKEYTSQAIITALISIEHGRLFNV
jgi:inosine/xanthosine triphosphatase